MKNFLSTPTLRIVAGLVSLWMLSACAHQSHMTEFPSARSITVQPFDEDAQPSHDNEAQVAPEEDGSFDVADIATDSQLDSSRGGFLYAGGLTLNFGLISSTSINGVIQSNLNLSTVSLQGGLPSGIQQLVQTSTAQTATIGSNTAPTSISTVSNTVQTIIQNSTNGAVIQTQNVLNLTVQNLRNFSSQVNLGNQRLSQALFLR